MIKIHQYNAEELERFRLCQRVSFDILDSIAAELRPGVSEIEATRKLRKAFHIAGAHNYFHVPVALFGDRSAYPGDFGAFEALPTDRTLNDGGTFQQIAWEVDDHIRERNYENCHRKHIGAVLGHLVTKADSVRLSTWTYKGLAVKQVSWFLARSRLARGRWRKMTPNWNHTDTCKGVAPHGLWAVEPHLALDGVGVKFEEILVIDKNGAEWLDDDLPHHRRWARFNAESQ